MKNLLSVSVIALVLLTGCSSKSTVAEVDPVEKCIEGTIISGRIDKNNAGRVDYDLTICADDGEEITTQVSPGTYSLWERGELSSVTNYEAKYR